MNRWPNFRIVSGITFFKITVGDMVTCASGQRLYINMFSSLQDGPQWYLLISLFIPLSHCVSIGLCGQQSTAEAKVCCFWDWVVKDSGFRIGSCSLGSLFLEESSRCVLRIHSQPKDRPRWQGTKASAQQPTQRCQQPCQLTQKQIVRPHSSLEVTEGSPSQWFECNLMRPWASLSEFLTLKNCEIRKTYCFQCYALG